MWLANFLCITRHDAAADCSCGCGEAQVAEERANLLSYEGARSLRFVLYPGRRFLDGRLCRLVIWSCRQHRGGVSQAAGHRTRSDQGMGLGDAFVGTAVSDSENLGRPIQAVQHVAGLCSVGRVSQAARHRHEHEERSTGERHPLDELGSPLSGKGESLVGETLDRGHP